MPSNDMKAVAERIASTWIRNPDGTYSKPGGRPIQPILSPARETFQPFQPKSPSFEEKPAKRIRQSTKPLLNKLETECLMVKQAQHPGKTIWKQALKWRLGNGIVYTPDLVMQINGRLTCYEVKGPHAFRGGMENLKVAASLYPEVCWVLTWKLAGKWCEQEVLP